MNENPARHYDPIAVSSKSTVVASYEADPKKIEHYQSEAALEREFIHTLQKQAYEYLPINTEADLVKNLRQQLETLNNVQFSASEWEQFFHHVIASKNAGILDKTKIIQRDHIQLLRRDDGTTKNIRLIDKDNVHNNILQVINQYEAVGNKSNRYDVTILVNGLPLIHVELKRRGIDLREAFNQINRYDRDSFWAGSGLFEYVQLFVISNGTLTKYYSNTTRHHHIKEQQGKRQTPKRANSFEFTSWWADETNKPIEDLIGFTKTFFAKHAILNILTKYCVFTIDKQLLVMRPYQIVATEKILNRVLVSTNMKQVGTIKAGGYIWHTTGSGKTLTSFKTAQLASEADTVDKVLFVVDRKDLDYQTMQEYDRFQKGAANSNRSTKVLKLQLEDPDARIIITTIQKLSLFVEQNRAHKIYKDHTVIIFDECHRSQFGDMHRAIRKAFKNYHLFGFTGTPIFNVNANSGGSPLLKTTEQVFGDKLHTYTIVDAITDRNVLPFRIDYIDSVQARLGIADKEVSAIASEEAMMSEHRISAVASYVLEHFDQKTKRNKTYALDKKRVRGFNSIFATASIEAAKRYYAMFKSKQHHLPPGDRLKIALIYSASPNAEEPDGILEEEHFEPSHLSKTDLNFLDDAIEDYNQMFSVSFNTSGDSFENYYKDVSQRMKERELDMLIVVNMFLTGFDAKTLNTLWVDKNLRQHGLLQAFSRTNRILNSIKTYGNIVAFRNIEENVDEAMRIFGDKDASGIALLKPYSHYFDEYMQRLDHLLAEFPVDERIVGEERQKEFIQLFGAILKLRNILTAFDEFEEDDPLPPRTLQDYQSRYLDLYQQYRKDEEAEAEDIEDDLVFEIELIKQVEINVDYILDLVEKHKNKEKAGEDSDTPEEISRAIEASPTLRNKKDLIDQFVATVSWDADIRAAWLEYLAERREAELSAIIAEERLRADQTRQFMADAFREGEVRTTGTAIARVMPRVSRFHRPAISEDYGDIKDRVIEKLKAFFDRFYGLGLEKESPNEP